MVSFADYRPLVAVTTRRELHRVSNYFSLYFTKYLTHREMFQMKVVARSGI
jgi:hypothetical protein